MIKRSDVTTYIGLHSGTIVSTVFELLMLLVFFWPIPYVFFGSHSWHGRLLSAPASILEPLLSERARSSWRENAAEIRGFLGRDLKNDSLTKGRTASVVLAVSWVAGLFLGPYVASSIPKAALYRLTAPHFVSEFRRLYLPFRSRFDSTSMARKDDA